MAARLYVVVCGNSPDARAAVWGSTEEAAYFGTAPAPRTALPIEGDTWGPPAVSADAAPLCSWGVWASLDPGTLLPALEALQAGGTVQVYTWDPTTGETLDQFASRWQTASGWQVLAPGAVPALVPVTG